jgi:hypothetical protein
MTIFARLPQNTGQPRGSALQAGRRWAEVVDASVRACLIGVVLGLGLVDVRGAVTNGWFGIQVVDDQTGRGVPLVELETVNHLRFVTDSAGRVAFGEPGLLGQPVFFLVRSHGYEFSKDGFGFAGKVLTPIAGGRAELRVRRVNLAERLCRITGEGLYRDSVLLGEAPPLAEPLGAGMVAGQDSVQVTPYQDKLYWFWGDTERMSYPLGHFGTAGAVSELPRSGGSTPADGVDFRYFTNRSGFSRPVCGLGTTSGAVWIDGLLTVPDATGRERLVAHYQHMESLSKMLAHGLAVFNDGRGEFELVRELDRAERWRFPQGQPVRHSEGGREWWLFGEVLLNVRVPARFESLTNAANYEAWTCLAPAADEGKAIVRRRADGQPAFAWTTNTPPLSPADEAGLVKTRQISAAEAHFQPTDVATGQPVELHRGSVRWNAFRQRWVMIACQRGGTSYLGEIWYLEAPVPTGPWRRAIKIVTHTNYSFYNPVQHDFFDQENGRIIYFEGTYTSTFADHPEPTPRYDYNQILYRLDLGIPQLAGARD